MWSSHALGVVRDVRIVTRRCLVRSALVPRTSSLETEQTDIKVYLIPNTQCSLANHESTVVRVARHKRALGVGVGAVSVSAFAVVSEWGKVVPAGHVGIWACGVAWVESVLRM